LRAAGTARGSGFARFRRCLGLMRRIRANARVDAVHPLVVLGKALDVPQVQETQPETPVTLVAGQPDQPVGALRVLVAAQPPSCRRTACGPQFSLSVKTVALRMTLAPQPQGVVAFLLRRSLCGLCWASSTRAAPHDRGRLCATTFRTARLAQCDAEQDQESRTHQPQGGR